MKRLLLSLSEALLAGLVAGLLPAVAVFHAAPAQAEDTLCTRVFAQMERARENPGASAIDFLRTDTTLGQQTRSDGDGAPGRVLDFWTKDRIVHPECFELKGHLTTQREMTARGIRGKVGEKPLIDVSIYVFAADSQYADVFRTNSESAGVLQLDGERIVQTYERGWSYSGPNTFEVPIAPYVKRGADLIKLSEPETVWLAADLENQGRKLMAVVCEKGCDAIQSMRDAPDEWRALAAAEAGATTDHDPRAPLRLQQDTITGASGEKTVRTEEETASAATNPFIGQTLTLYIQPKGGLPVSRMDIVLEQAVRGMTPDDVQSVQGTLADLNHPEPNKRLDALFILKQRGIIPDTVTLSGDSIPEQTSLGYHVVLSAPSDEEYGQVGKPDPQPTYFTNVVLQMDRAYSHPIITTCKPRVEILADGSALASADLTWDFDANRARTRMKPIKGAFDASGGADMSRPVDQLAIRIFVPKPAEGEPEPSCDLIWSDIFPSQDFALAEAGRDSSLPVSIDRDGVVTFSGVSLVSTARPVHLLVYTTTGPEDSNGAKTVEHLYPKWSEPKLAEALNTLLGAAEETFAEKTDKIFVSTPLGGRDQKDFGNPMIFTDPEEVARNLVPGEIGLSNLDYAISERFDSTGVIPRFVILGRTGLSEASDYCAQVPKLPQGAENGSVLIDFVPSGAVRNLPSDVEQALGNPPFGGPLKEAMHSLAARCPEDGSGLVHWVLTPDLANSLFLNQNLTLLSRHIFGELQ